MSQPSRDVRYHHHDKKEYCTPTITAEVKEKLARYVNAGVEGEDDWTRASEIPTEAEVGWIQNGTIMADAIEIPSAKISGSYASREHYLKTQYHLMRSDGVLPLARGVNDYRNGLGMTESKDIRIYNEVFVTSLMVTRDGLALKLEFSATAIGQIVRWAKSKRLRSGSLVALTPASDDFKTKCVPAVVASRLMENLEVKSPQKPSIWVYISDYKQIEIDSQQKWTMVECTQGYWEAYRHTLRALQKIRLESFPMEEHLVAIKTDVSAPNYRSESPIMNLNAIVNREETKLEKVNVLDQWPRFQEAGKLLDHKTQIATEMDDSQVDALKRILTKKLAIVQGPPGTGKTYTSVTAIKVLLKNMTRTDPPIIIAAQTNHAVDQILRQIAKFEPEFIRLGGQTTDHVTIKPRTLYELKASRNLRKNINSKTASNMRKVMAAELEQLLAPLSSSEPITANAFHEAGLLTVSQQDSINNLESAWVADRDANKMNLWCENGLKKIVNIDEDNSYVEQMDEEYENLDEKEMEAPDDDDDRFEQLFGPTFELAAGYRFSGRPSGIQDEDIANLLSRHEDLLEIPKKHRPAVYGYLRRQLVKKVTHRIHSFGETFKHAAQTAKIGKWETEYEFLRKAKVIGLTTTGLSKYRGLLSVLNPKIVLVEEAAETLEPYTIAAVFDTIEHLILVGDHQQLRANCCCTELAETANFDVSMFERLVKNQVEFTRLTSQRRMRPEIRSLIKHIYPDLTDHASVVGRPGIRGMGGIDLHFFHHGQEESMDESRSKKNVFEAKMIVEFTKYLVWNDVSLDKITILTYYNGQKKLLIELFRRHELFYQHRVKICTVDSYQGEENDIVLLSLVRNNKTNSIGFLESINRACVALSRARLGLYIFGNAKLLIRNLDWAAIIGNLQEQEAVRSFLPIYCAVHKTETDVKEYSDLQTLNGGCDEDCGGTLPCGHKCPLKCHPARECNAEDCEESCEKEPAVESTRTTEIQRFEVQQKDETSLVPEAQAYQPLVSTKNNTKSSTREAVKKWADFASTASKTPCNSSPKQAISSTNTHNHSHTRLANSSNDLIDLTGNMLLDESVGIVMGKKHGKNTESNTFNESLI